MPSSRAWSAQSAPDPGPGPARCRARGGAPSSEALGHSTLSGRLGQVADRADRTFRIDDAAGAVAVLGVPVRVGWHWLQRSRESAHLEKPRRTGDHE
jgi:hypothetical protein